LRQIISQFSIATAATGSQPPVEVAAQSPFEPVFDPGIDQGMVIRKILPPPDSLRFDMPEKHICLITDNGTPLTAELTQALLAKNWPVVVLRFPAEVAPCCQPLPDAAQLYDLADMSEAVLQASLAEIEQKHGQVAVFIHLGLAGQNGKANGGGTSAVHFPKTEKALVKMVFLAAKHLKQALNSVASPGRAAFMTVTQLDGEFGLGRETDFNPISGGLFGLVKTLNLEWEPVFCRAVDINPALTASQAVRCILAELHDPNRLITEVGYTTTERSTLILEAVPVTGGR
jgi:hypothetical protein